MTLLQLTKNIVIVFLALLFYNWEFDKDILVYCHDHSLVVKYTGCPKINCDLRVLNEKQPKVNS